MAGGTFSLVGEIAGAHHQPDRLVLFGTGPIEAQAAAAKRLETLTPNIEALCTCGHSASAHLSGPQRTACRCGCPAPITAALTCPCTWGTVVQLAATFGAAWRPGPALTAWVTDEFTRRTTVENHPEGDLLVAPPPGLTPRAYQVAGARMIGMVGSAILADEPGTGKSVTTVMGLRERAARGHQVTPIVIVCPPAVVDHWVEHIHRWAPEWRAVAWKGSPARRAKRIGTADVYVATYGTARSDASTADKREIAKGKAPLLSLGARYVVCDECLPPGTLIDTPAGPRPIEELRVGDEVLGVDHATGELVPTTVRHTFANPAPDELVEVHGVAMTPNHPVWTSRGYVRADEVRTDDELCEVQASEHGDHHVRVVRAEEREALPAYADGTVLRSGVLGSMAYVAPGVRGENGREAGHPGVSRGERGAYAGDAAAPGGAGEALGAPTRVVEPVPGSGGAGEGSRRHAGTGLPGTHRWERAGTHGAAGDDRRRVGVADRSGRADRTPGTVPLVVQGRRRVPGAADRGGVRRGEPQRPEGTRAGRPERCVPARAQVDGAPVPEPAHPRGHDRGARGDQGRGLVHNIETGTGNYVAAGLLVHNCHMTKAQASGQSWAVRRLAAVTDGFVGLSGTPITHALTLDSPLLTPTGWRPMGDIEIGDTVIGADGRPTEVIGVHPQGPRQVFRVTFSDGATVDCTGDHLWAVNTRSRRSKGLPNLVLRTEELTEPRGRGGSAGGLFDQGGAPRWSTPTVAAVEMLSTPVPLDPYLLGTLLANGYLASPPELITPDTEVAEYVRAALPAGLGLTARPRTPRQGNADAYKITSGRVGGSLPGTRGGAPSNAVTAALTDLGLLGCRAWEKFIPERYLWNSEAVRLDVLRGLVDGDGTSVGSTVKYDTTSPALADGVKFLVRSLGGYVTETVTPRDPVRMPQGHMSPARPMHTLFIGMLHNPFRVKRKADTWAPRWRVKGRSIIAIEARDVAPVQCITVAADDGLYVTSDFVVTHNSPGDLWPALYCMSPGAWPSRERWITRYCETVSGDYASEVLGLDPRAEPEFRATILGQFRRVAKADVLAQLPPKVWTVRRVELPAAYRKAYDTFEADMLAELPDTGELEAMTVLSQMGRLLQLASSACDVDTVTEEVEDPMTGAPIERKHQHVTMRNPSWKVDELLDILDDRGGPRSGSQVAVYAPSRQLMVLAGEAAAKAGYRVGYVIGTGPLHPPKPAMFTVSAAMSAATADFAGLDIDAPDAFEPDRPADAGPAVTMATRRRDVAAFQAGDLDVICVTTGAGGVGLTLTAASAAVFLARPWSSVQSSQAEDRQHRIGSEFHLDGTLRDCIDIIDVVAVGTIESRIREVLVERAGQLSELVKDPRIVEEILGGSEVRDLRKTTVDTAPAITAAPARAAIESAASTAA